MSQRITVMDHGQGFTANLVTSFLVTIASGWGVPVSTTHVSVGALCGIGVATRAGQWDRLRVELFGSGVEWLVLSGLLEPDWVVADIGTGPGPLAAAPGRSLVRSQAEQPEESRASGGALQRLDEAGRSGPAPRQERSG